MTPPTREQIIARALTWVTAKVPYSMFRFWHGWRADCSGLVSMAWALDQNYWTGNLHRAGVRLPSKLALQPGDMLLFHNPANPNSGSHVVLFERWVDRPGGDFWIIEQTGAGGGRPRRITWSGTRRTNLGLYVPYRPLNLTTPAPAGGATDQGAEDMKIILGNVKGQLTIWSGLRGIVPAFAHSIEESVNALAAAGAVRVTFTSAEAMYGALGAEEGDDTGAETIERMKAAK